MRSLDTHVKEKCMIKTFLSCTAVTLALLAGTMSSAPAQAQVGIEVGPGGARVYEDRPRVERRIIERRSPSRRVVVEDDNDDEVCETRTRRVRVNGVMRTRRVTVCD
jgi:hypothetical protein